MKTWSFSIHPRSLPASLCALALVLMTGVIFVPNAAVAAVNTAPVITTQPVAQTSNSGTAVTFSVVATGSPAPTYQWQKGGVVIAAATSASYSIASVAVGDAGNYTVIVTNVVGAVTSNAAVLTVQWTPVITKQPAAQTVVPGQNAAFTIGATGNPAPSFQWQRLAAGSATWSNLSDGGNYVGGTTSMLLVSSATLVMNGDQFRCVTTNVAGAVTSASAALSALIPATWGRGILLMNQTNVVSETAMESIDPAWRIATAADFNGDGHADLILQNVVTGEHNLWLMNGTTRIGVVDLGTTDPTWQIAGTGNFNGDSSPDILWQNIATGQHSIWLMNGTTNIGNIELGTTNPVWRMTGTGDFNGDGQTDILWQNIITGQHSIWLMNGTTNIGNFELSTTDPTWRIAGTGDFNGNGQTDILWQNTVSGQMSVWLMNGTTYVAGVDVGVADPNWQAAAVGDFNGDGSVDVVRQRKVAIRNDLNGDGYTDVLWHNSVTGQHSIWLMNGTTYLGGVELSSTAPTWQIAGTGDFNGDGQTDIIWHNTVTGQHSLWLMNGTNYVSGVELGTTDPVWQIAGTGDFNGDGQTDILWQNIGSGQHSIWLMNGTTNIGTVDLAVTAPTWVISGTGDFNGDGQTDILWQNITTGQHSIWLMTGTTNTGTIDLGTTDPAWQMAGTGDFNGDGQMDILWQNITTGQHSIWLMRGTTNIGTVDLGTTDPLWQIAGSGANNGYPAAASSNADASRFLIQASFGPTTDSINRIRSISYAGWIDEQLAMAPTYHLPYYNARSAEFMARSGGTDDGYLTPRQEAWWQHAITAPDQLRQRMAFALSQILVISQDSSLEDDNQGVTVYYDILMRNAFGNYRQLLEDVTLSPMMGTYLSMIRNQKPNTKTGRAPDENFAREIMQLFTIGLSQLNIDGTLQLGSDGLSIPTYTQADIVGLAHVFTGWGPYFDPANPPKYSNGTVAKASDWFLYGWDGINPMTFNATYGDLQARQIVGGVTVSATLTGPQRLKLAIDTLFNHPNVGPFLARQLIQRFVTSNPSPAYIRRVATVFNNNGAGVRGDLGATLRALLLDPEARGAASLVDTKFGKLTEPLLRMTRLFRAFTPTPRPYAATGDNRLFLNFVYSMDEQSPLFSPTVFNFYKPGFAKAGTVATAGMVSPEFQIYDDVTAMLETNRNYNFIFSNIYVGEPVSTGTNMKLDLNEPLAILTAPGRTHADAQAAMVDYFNQRLMGGTMSAFLRQKILDTYASLPTTYTYTAANELRRVQVGLYLVMFSPEFNIQR